MVGSGVFGAPQFSVRRSLNTYLAGTVDFEKYPAQKVGPRFRAVSTQGSRQVCLSRCRDSGHFSSNFPPIFPGTPDPCPIWLDDRGTGQWKWMEEVPQRTYPLRPLVSNLFNRRASRGGRGSFPLCGGTSARSYSVSTRADPRNSHSLLEFSERTAFKEPFSEPLFLLNSRKRPLLRTLLKNLLRTLLRIAISPGSYRAQKAPKAGNTKKKLQDPPPWAIGPRKYTKTTEKYKMARKLRHFCIFRYFFRIFGAQPRRNCNSKKRFVAWPPWCAPYQTSAGSPTCSASELSRPQSITQKGVHAHPLTA